MTKPCESCTKTFIDEGVERKRDYPLERECIECLKAGNDNLKELVFKYLGCYDVDSAFGQNIAVQLRKVVGWGGDE